MYLNQLKIGQDYGILDEYWDVCTRSRRNIVCHWFAFLEFSFVFIAFLQWSIKKPDNYKYIRWSMTPLKIENRKLHKHHVYLHRYTVCFIRHAFELKKRKKNRTQKVVAAAGLILARIVHLTSHAMYIT